MDLTQLLAVMTVLSGLIVAYNTRRKNEGDISLSAVEAANIALQMSQKMNDELEAKIDGLLHYIDYLRGFIAAHMKEAPMSIDEYTILKKQTPPL